MAGNSLLLSLDEPGALCYCQVHSATHAGASVVENCTNMVQAVAGTRRTRGMFLVSGTSSMTKRVIRITQPAKKRKMPNCSPRTTAHTTQQRTRAAGQARHFSRTLGALPGLTYSWANAGQSHCGCCAHCFDSRQLFQQDRRGAAHPERAQHGEEALADHERHDEVHEGDQRVARGARLQGQDL